MSEWKCITKALSLLMLFYSSIHVFTEKNQKLKTTRMWVSAQRDGCPVKYRWRPLFNAAKFGWRSILARVPCSKINATKTRNPLKFAGVPQTRQQISAASEPKFTILWRHVGETLLFNQFFFQLSIRALLVKIQPDKIVRWCVDGEFLAIFCVLYFFSEPRTASFRPAS